MAEKAVKKGAKKGFYSVEIPMVSTKVSLYGASNEELAGRVVKLDMTRSLRGKAFELRVRVNLEGESLRGEPISLILAGSYIRRMMRKGADYVEDSFKAECKDNKLVIKPFLITRNKVSRAIRKELRNSAKKYIESYLKARTSKDVFSDVITNKLQKELSLKLKKIYPLALCEIRWFEIEEKKESNSK